MTARLRLSWIVAAAALIATACASSAPPVPEHASQTKTRRKALEEGRAMAVIDDLLLEAKVLPVQGWRVRLDAPADLDVDVRLGDSEFGIEWVSDRDRADYGSALPPADPQGQLRLLGGADSNRRALILVLDSDTYAFDQATALASGEDAREAEDRLRRDLRDFLDYVKSQR